MTINNKSERNYQGKCLGWPVTSYGAEMNVYFSKHTKDFDKDEYVCPLSLV